MARGHICKRGKSYSVVIYLGKDTNGKKHQKWYTCKTKKEAESLLVTKLSELENGTFILNDNIILSDFLNYWYSEYCLKKLSATPYESYKRNIDNYIIPNLGNIKIKDLKLIQRVPIQWCDLHSAGCRGGQRSLRAERWPAPAPDRVHRGRTRPDRSHPVLSAPASVLCTGSCPNGVPWRGCVLC